VTPLVYGHHIGGQAKKLKPVPVTEKHRHPVVLEARKTVLGEEHPDTLDAMFNLAATSGRLGHWKDAQELQVHVMEARKWVLGEEYPGTLSAMSNLATTYWRLGQWKDAEELEVYAMEASKRPLVRNILTHWCYVQPCYNLSETGPVEGC
jgi:Tetratricopeptide repeat